MRLAFAIVSALFHISFCAHGVVANGQDQPRRAIVLSLEVIEKIVKQGAVPKFRLAVRTSGRDPQRVLDLRNGRHDLQDTYYDLQVTAGDKAVDLPRGISDPGPISAKDFVTLKAGEAVTLELSRFALALERLPPGRYKARVRFWQDPYESSATSFLSPPVEFVVQK